MKSLVASKRTFQVQHKRVFNVVKMGVIYICKQRKVINIAITKTSTVVKYKAPSMTTKLVTASL